MKSQDSVRELYAAYLSGSLTEAQAAALLRALEGDERFRREVLDDAEAHGLLGQLGAEPEAETFRRSLMARIDAEGTSSRFMKALRDRRELEPLFQKPRPRWIPAAYATLLVAIGILLTILATDRREAAPDPADASAGAPRPEPVVNAPRDLTPVPKPPAPAERPVDPPSVERTPEPPKPVDRAQAKPAPVEVPATLPEPPPRPPEPKPDAHAPRATVVQVGSLEGVRGDVYLVVGTARRAAREGSAVLEGQGVETGGAGSAVTMACPDGTRVDLGRETSVRCEPGTAGAGRGLFMARGTLTATIAELPLVVATPEAEAKASSARLTVQAEKASTRLEVSLGRAQFVRREDRTAVEVREAQFAVAAEGVPLFARAIQEKKQNLGAHPGVDPRRVGKAIQRGIEFLKTSDSPGHNASKNADELILLTFLHAGAEGEARFKELFEKMLKAPLEATYSVALQAMVLEEYERVRFQGRIHQCAQFLVDNQCANGQWSYGSPTTYPEAVPVPRGEVVTGTPRKPATRPRGVIDFEAPEPGARPKPRVVQHLAVKKNRDGGAAGDNSNSQYAALGIRACHDAGIVFPKDVIEKARKHWVDTQEKGEDKGGAPAVATGPGAAGVPRGWGYKPDEGGSYGSMSAGALGSVCIYDFILGIDYKKDKAAQDGAAWLGKFFIPNDNPNRSKWFHLYYLYAVERAGMLYDTTRFGPHDWYMIGANWLLDNQNANGSWGTGERLDPPSWGTCFAILFLKQATRRLDVASTDPNKK
jgi:hypothetical protein